MKRYNNSLDKLEGILTIDDFRSENLPEDFINFCSIITKNAHFYQTRTKTGEPYKVHLDEVAGLGAFCVKSPFKAYTRAQLRLHDWDEDAQDNKDSIYNLTTFQREFLGLPKQEQHIHFSPLFTEFGTLGQFAAQTVRLFNKELISNYLEGEGIIQNFLEDTKDNKELKYFYYIESLTGNLGFPTILKKQPELNKDFHSFFLSLGKAGDLISNMDIGKPFNFNYQRRRLNLSDDDIKENYNNYLAQKRRNCERVLSFIPILSDSLKSNQHSKYMLIEKNLDLICKSSSNYALDYLEGKIEY